MLTNEELERLRRYVAIAQHMDAETQQKVLELIRKLKAAEAQGSIMPQSAVQAMVDAVPDRLMADVVKDLRTPAQASSMIPKGRPSDPVKSNMPARKPEPPSGTQAAFDAMVDYWAGGANDTSKLR